MNEIFYNYRIYPLNERYGNSYKKWAVEEVQYQELGFQYSAYNTRLVAKCDGWTDADAERQKNKSEET